MASETERERVRSTSLSKILTDENLVLHIDRLRRQGVTIVHCHGVFDILHPGHIAHLEEAKTHGGALVVSVTADEFVNKGPGRPVLSATLRATMLAALQVVDFVWISRHLTAVHAIALLKPDFFVKGPDYAGVAIGKTGDIQLEVAELEKHGGRAIFTNAPAMSSSSIINSVGLAHKNELNKWLQELRGFVSIEAIENWFTQIQELKVLVIGETIVDSYVFVDALGKTSKEPVLAFLREESEDQLGGSLAIASHFVGLGAKTSVLTRVGKDGPGAMASRRIRGLVSLNCIIQESADSKTIVKTRFVDKSTGIKVFETYEMTDAPTSSADDDEFVGMIDKLIDDFDVIVVADYGHGLLSKKVIGRLVNSKGLLSVNTQSNAGNRGFNSIGRYPRVDIVSLNGGEIKLELKQKHTTVRRLLPDLGASTGARWVVVTEGAKGLSVWSAQNGVVDAPAFTEVVKDRIGAGDAVFAVVTALLAVGAPSPEVCLFGNLAGASNVSGLGNQYSVNSLDLIRHAKVLLK